MNCVPPGAFLAPSPDRHVRANQAYPCRSPDGQLMLLHVFKAFTGPAAELLSPKLPRRLDLRLPPDFHSGSLSALPAVEPNLNRRSTWQAVQLPSSLPACSRAASSSCRGTTVRPYRLWQIKRIERCEAYLGGPGRSCLVIQSIRSRSSPLCSFCGYVKRSTPLRVLEPC